MSNNKINRATRFVSHALVEVKKYKNLPFGTYSAVLLDISQSGFKLEFTGEITVKNGDTFWLHIPLAPLGIMAPSKLDCRIEIKWFDEEMFRIGGVFTSLSKNDKLIITQIYDTLKERGVCNL